MRQAPDHCVPLDTILEFLAEHQPSLMKHRFAVQRLTDRADLVPLNELERLFGEDYPAFLALHELRSGPRVHHASGR